MKEGLQIKTPARNKFVTGALRTPYATQREMWTNWKQTETKHNLKNREKHNSNQTVQIQDGNENYPTEFTIKL